MMKATRLFALALVLTLLITLGRAADAQEPQLLQNGGCIAGSIYDPACDVNHDDTINIIDLALVANHWHQAGTFTSDNEHDHLGQTWTGSNNPLVIDGSFADAPLMLSNNSGDGMIVEAAAGHGMRVNSAGFNGMVIEVAEFDGMVVNSAGFDGMVVNSADVDGVVVNSAGDFAGFFDGNVAITGTCTGCTLAALGYNAGQTALEPGDVVAVRGVTQTDLPNTPMVMDVALADGPDGVIGVVAGRAELNKHHHDKSGNADETVLRLVPREGPAGPGEYVSIVIYGLAQVKASAVDSPIQHGTRLTAADQPGYARAVRTVEVQGVQVAENTPVIGVALESLKDGQALIWALVNPR
jgi:hypothetical protein